jgi:hypothetical protein
MPGQTTEEAVDLGKAGWTAAQVAIVVFAVVAHDTCLAMRSVVLVRFETAAM